MTNFLDNDMLSPDKQGRKPTILVNIADDDVTRGDTAGRLGLARAIAKKIDGEVIYTDKPKIDKLYPDTIDKIEEYDTKLAKYLSQYRSPDIMLGLGCSNALQMIGKNEHKMLYVTGFNERLSSTMIDERHIVSHHLTNDMLKEEGQKFDIAYPHLTKPIIALFLVEPKPEDRDYFTKKISAITEHYDEATIFLCGSRRTPNDYYLQLKKDLEKNVPNHIKIDGFQFDREAEFNPYRGLIARADHFMLWGNSMSMMSEPLITGKTVHLYKYGIIDDSLVERGIVSNFTHHAEDTPLLTKNFSSINVTEQLADKLLENLKKKNAELIETEETKYNLDKLPKKWHKHLIKIQIDHNHINHVPPKIRHNSTFIKHALSKNGMVLQHLSKKQQDNVQLAEIAVLNNHFAMPFTGDTIRDDTNAMFNILKSVYIKRPENIYALLSDRLKSCPDFTLQLLKAEIDIVESLDTDLFKHRDICLYAIKEYQRYVGKVPDHFINDDSFVKDALEKNVYCFQYLPEKYRKDSDIIDYILKEKPYLIEYAADEIRDNEEIMLKFINKDHNIYSHASEHLQNDKKFALEAFKYNDVAYSIPSEMWNDKDITLVAVKSNCNNISLAKNTETECDLDVCREALSQQLGVAWHYLSEKAQENADISFIAFEEQESLWKFLRYDIKQDKNFLLRCASLPYFSVDKIDNKHYLDQKFIKEITTIRPEWKDAPEFADTLRLIRYKENLSTVFNAVTAPIKIIKAFKHKFQKEQKLKM